MAESPVFEWVSNALEERTRFNRLQARGTVRRALRQGGLDPELVSTKEMDALLEHVMPAALAKRGVDEAQQLCVDLKRAMATADLADATSREPTPEEIFSRVFGDSD